MENSPSHFAQPSITFKVPIPKSSQKVGEITGREREREREMMASDGVVHDAENLSPAEHDFRVLELIALLRLLTCS